MENKYLSIADFAAAAQVSKQAIYKQISNENSQLAPYILHKGKRTLINAAALSELYKVEIDLSTFSTEDEADNTTYSTDNSTAKVDEVESKTTQADIKNQPFQPISTAENQPLSSDYIDFLKAEIAELKADKAQTEQRLNDTIKAKDEIIRQQTEKLADLAQQVADIATKALITTSQQQYLTAAEKVDKQDQPTDGVIVEEDTPKKNWFSRIFHRD